MCCVAGYSSCRHSVAGLRLGGGSEAECHLYVMSLINLSAVVLVSAVGGLLYYLQRSFLALQSPVLAVHNLSLKNTVWVDEETIHALQIFAPLAHPSSYKWSSGGAKEGLSVFSLLNRCYSSVGAKYMRVLLSQPTRDVETLHCRHQVISFCLKPVHEQVVKSLATSLGHVKSVMKILTRMTNAQASVAEWKAFYYTIYNAVLVGEICREHSKEVQFFQQVAECLCDSIFIMSHCINQTMDFEESALQSRVVVKFGISDELDQVKETLTNLSSVMEQVAEQELQELPEYIESCSMVYIPEVGYLLAVPYWQPDLTEDQLMSLPDLQYKFKTKDVVHYKSARCCELDNSLGDIQLKVIEIESKIVLRLVEYIQLNISPLVKLISLVAQLDCIVYYWPYCGVFSLLALAQAARDYSLVQPTMTEDKQINVTRGRHLLQELCVDVFVPNDTHSSPSHGYVKILSGPNASGKSVYLKQVALIVYLAHVGSFVPAERATIGIVDQILSRIQTLESVSSHLSAFMMDLRQMSMAVCNASSNSLVLVDEFGKGTSEVDGLGILAACLEHFVHRQENCPHLFVSTHFHSLPSLLPSSPNVRLQTFEHMVDKGELVYLYRLKDGAVEDSFALQVAHSHGLSQAAVNRASQILKGLREAAELTADNSNRLTQVTHKRSLFLKRLCDAEVTDEQLNTWKKELTTLRL